MKTEDLHYFLERYLAEEMEPSEKKWFEKEIEGNSTLQQELNLRRATDRILQHQDLMLLKSKLRIIDEEHRSKRHSGALRKRTVSYAAAIAVMVFVAGTLYMPSLKRSPEHLFEKYYEIPPVAEQSALRSLDISSGTHFSQAVEMYNRGEYNEAIDLFLLYTSDNAAGPGVNMMLGNSYMEIMEYQKAGNSYQSVIDHDNNLYIEDANWLLGLCYLKTGDTEKAREQMDKISSSPSRHAEKATSILKKLR